jgi:hypothetical protein
MANIEYSEAPTSESFAPNPFRWYAAKVKTPNEQRLANYLQENQVETFLPVIRRRRCPPITAFSGYLFVSLDLSITGRTGFWQDRPSVGFLGLVSFGGQPATIDTEVIDILKAEMAHQDGIFYGGLNPGELHHGQPIVVTAGKFKSLRGIFQREAKERVTVLLSLFNRPVNVELPLSDVMVI